ncbi:MAG: site-2 protease family protein [Deltaproteobacteria bacterium]|nr:site-2 protease family protein [Deltaproteobacteria bacterium]
MVESFLQSLSVWALPVLAAIVLHELAHGLVAYWLGDQTAARAGRLTLNPLAHVDPIGSVALPLLLLVLQAPFLFGYAKPVPVNFGQLRRPRRDMVLVAAAGPATNLLLAVVSAVGLQLLLSISLSRDSAFTGVAVATLTPLALMARNSVIINVVLAVFNLLPLLPLDGGRVLVGLLPRAQAIAFARLEPFGMMIVFALLATHTLSAVIGPVVNLFLRALL